MSLDADNFFRMSDLSGNYNRYNLWIVNFAKKVAAGSPAANGFTAAQVTTVATLAAAWALLYAAATDPATRTHKTVVALQTFRYVETLLGTPSAAGPSATSQFRAIIKTMQGSGLNSPDVLASFGLTTFTAKRVKTTVPAYGPEIEVVASLEGQFRMRYSSPVHGPRIASKPKGIKSVMLYWRAGNGQAGSVPMTKTPFTLELGKALSGQQITMEARYFAGMVKGKPSLSPPGSTITDWLR